MAVRHGIGIDESQYGLHLTRAFLLTPVRDQTNREFFLIDRVLKEWFSLSRAFPPGGRREYERMDRFKRDKLSWGIQEGCASSADTLPKGEGHIAGKRELFPGPRDSFLSGGASIITSRLFAEGKHPFLQNRIDNLYFLDYHPPTHYDSA
jgi:hypothetical protein